MERAIKLSNGKEFEGKKIWVNMAQFGQENRRERVERVKKLDLMGRKIFEKILDQGRRLDHSPVS